MSDSQKQKDITLPGEIVSPRDIQALIADLQSVDHFLLQARVRTPGTKMSLPHTTAKLETLAKANQLRLLHDDDRRELALALHRIDVHAPKMRFTFATHPSPSQLTEFVGWLRATFHPHLLLFYSIKPTIGAGCIIKTPKRTIDLSHDSLLQQHHAELAQLLKP